MYRGNTTRHVLPSLARGDEAGALDHGAELFLRGEALDALDEVLVRVAVSGDEVADQRNRRKAPALVKGVEDRVRDLAELEAGEDAAGLEDAVRLVEGGGDVAEVADAEGDGVEVEGAGGDGGGGEGGGVGFEEGEGGLLGGGEGEGALLANGEHRGVDVGDGYVHGGVAVEDVGVVEHAECDVACSAGDVEDALGFGGGGGG